MDGFSHCYLYCSTFVLSYWVARRKNLELFRSVFRSCWGLEQRWRFWVGFPWHGPTQSIGAIELTSNDPVKSNVADVDDRNRLALRLIRAEERPNNDNMLDFCVCWSVCRVPNQILALPLPGTVHCTICTCSTVQVQLGVIFLKV